MICSNCNKPIGMLEGYFTHLGRYTHQHCGPYILTSYHICHICHKPIIKGATMWVEYDGKCSHYGCGVPGKSSWWNRLFTFIGIRL